MRLSLTAPARVFLALVLVVAASGCELLEPFQQKGVEFDEIDQADVAPGPEIAVPLTVEDGSQGGTLVFVPVYFGDDGPHSFALDTGASHSIIDEKLVEEVGLPLTGETRALSGVGGLAEAVNVQVDAWRIDDVDLPPLSVASALLAAGDTHTLRGLLGSDVLSEFERITIDYREEVMLLQPRSESPGS